MRAARGAFIVGVVAFGSLARADDIAKAREHYVTAQRAYELGSYEEAIREYSEAYRLKDDPAFLYNIAQAQRLAEHPVEALRSYKMFLIKVPNAPNRAEVVAKIDVLQKVIEEQRKAKNLPPDTTLPATPKTPSPAPETQQSSTAPPPQPATAQPPVATPTTDMHAGRTKKIAGLAIGIVGIAAVGAGIATLVLAKQASDSLTAANQNGQPFDRGKYDAGKTENIAGAVLLGVGGAAVVAGVIVGVIGIREAKSQKLALIPWTTGRAAGLLCEVRR